MLSEPQPKAGADNLAGALALTGGHLRAGERVQFGAERKDAGLVHRHPATSHDPEGLSKIGLLANSCHLERGP